MANLGMILTPYGQLPVNSGYPSEIGYSYGGSGTWLCPDDPQYYTSGEAGFYHDTPMGGTGLGAVPTDDEIASAYGWTPMITGWVTTAEGRFSQPYRPPNNWGPAGPWGDWNRPFRPGMSGLGDDPAAVMPPPTIQDLMTAINDHNQRVFTLTVVSTFAVALSAILTVIRTAKLMRQEAKKHEP